MVAETAVCIRKQIQYAIDEKNFPRVCVIACDNNFPAVITGIVDLLQPSRVIVDVSLLNIGLYTMFIVYPFSACNVKLLSSNCIYEDAKTYCRPKLSLVRLHGCSFRAAGDVIIGREEEHAFSNC